jgi:hypothetical protein
LTDSNHRPRAVFAPKDWEVLKKAVGNYVNMCEQYCVSEEEMTHALSLYHRIGRVIDVNEVRHKPLEEAQRRESYEQTMKRLMKEDREKWKK